MSGLGSGGRDHAPSRRVCALMLSECRPKSSPSFLLATIAVAAGSRDPIKKEREEGHAQVGRTARHSAAFEQTL
jgi:hypothetical protein